ncbi:MAG: helix-turn-helix transcriptional regulator [Hyphomicrobiales bacterium]|nr:helix-turn-helix transcriptional regulator [Hyphomicrobiales bacterium]MBV9754777.1 helix-turn-helix transcriptional regulator [Hyphomicrobiales bacterium]
MKTSVPFAAILATFSSERQQKVKKRAAELIAEEFTLRDLRKSKRITQEEVARRLSGRQGHVSRLEQRADMKLSTLREYVRALGGDLQLRVIFPAEIAREYRDTGPEPTRRNRTTSLKKASSRKTA